MKNPMFDVPNFIVLHQEVGNGPIYQVTLCQQTLQVLEKKEINEIPTACSIIGFYQLLNEGKRLLGNASNS